MPEKRTRTRIPTEFRAGRVKGRGKVRNISEGGLFVGTTAIPEQGDTVELLLSVPGQPPVAVTGMVWWTTGDSDRRYRHPGFGLRVLEENEAYLQVVANLV